MWDHGQQAGKARFLFIFRVQSHLKQLKMCVRTEYGVMEAGPIFKLGKSDSLKKSTTFEGFATFLMKHDSRVSGVIK